MSCCFPSHCSRHPVPYDDIDPGQLETYERVIPEPAPIKKDYKPSLNEMHPIRSMRKTVNTTLFTDQQKQLLRTKGRRLSDLTCPNLLHCSSFREEQTVFHFDFDSMDGGTIFNHIRRRQTLYEKDIRDIIRGALLGLLACHSVGLFVGILKPENLMFAHRRDASNAVKLDVSECSLLKEDSIYPSRRLGPSCYYAPEVLMRGDFGPPADLWYVGLMAHILLVGALPFEFTKSRNLLITQIVGMGTVFASGVSTISKDAKDFMSQLLRANETDRLNVNEALEHEWFRADLCDVNLNEQLAMLKGMSKLAYKL